MLRAAALLLIKCSANSVDSGEFYICSRNWLHTDKHYFGLPIYKYKYDKYYAAERLLSAYFNAAYSKGTAYSAEVDNEERRSARESAYFYFSTSVSLSFVFYYSTL